MSPSDRSLVERVLDDDLLTREQVAEILGVNPLTVMRMISRGEFPCVRYSRRVRIRASDIHTWLRTRTASVDHGRTDEEAAAIERKRTLHDACRCAHVVELLASLLAKQVEARPAPAPAPNAPPEEAKDGSFEKLLGAKDVAELLGVSALNVTRMLRDGRLPGMRVGRRRLIRRKDLELFLERSRT